MQVRTYRYGVMIMKIDTDKYIIPNRFDKEALEDIINEKITLKDFERFKVHVEECDWSDLSDNMNDMWHEFKGVMNV